MNYAISTIDTSFAHEPFSCQSLLYCLMMRQLRLGISNSTHAMGDDSKWCHTVSRKLIWTVCKRKSFSNFRKNLLHCDVRCRLTQISLQLTSYHPWASWWKNVNGSSYKVTRRQADQNTFRAILCGDSFGREICWSLCWSGLSRLRHATVDFLIGSSGVQLSRRATRGLLAEKRRRFIILIKSRCKCRLEAVAEDSSSSNSRHRTGRTFVVDRCSTRTTSSPRRIASTASTSAECRCWLERMICERNRKARDISSTAAWFTPNTLSWTTATWPCAELKRRSRWERPLRQSNCRKTTSAAARTARWLAGATRRWSAAFLCRTSFKEHFCRLSPTKSATRKVIMLDRERCARCRDSVKELAGGKDESDAQMSSWEISIIRSDSGGPLQCDENLVGIVSYGTRVCAVSMPDVYTRASEYVGELFPDLHFNRTSQMSVFAIWRFQLILDWIEENSSGTAAESSSEASSSGSSAAPTESWNRFSYFQSDPCRMENYKSIKSCPPPAVK